MHVAHESCLCLLSTQTCSRSVHAVHPRMSFYSVPSACPILTNPCLAGRWAFNTFSILLQKTSSKNIADGNAPFSPTPISMGIASTGAAQPPLEQPTETLLTQTYRGRSRAVITAAYFGSYFSIGVCLASLGPVLPALSRRLDTSLEVMGYLFVARSVGNVIGSLVGGVVFDRTSRPHVPLLIGNLLCAVGCVALPLLTSVAALACAVVTQGLCMGLLDTGGNVLLIWLHGTGRVEPFMQAMHFCFALGAVLAPLAVEACTRLAGDPDTFDTAFYLMGGTIALASLPLALTRGPSPPKAGSENAASADDVKIDAIASRGAISSIVWLVGGSGLCLLFYVGAEVASGGFVYAYAREYLGMDAAAAHALNSTYWGGLAAGRLLAIPLATRLRPAMMLVSDLAGALIASVLMLTLTPRGVPGGAPLAWIAFGALGLAHASIYPTIITHAERCMRVTGRIASIFVVSGAIGEAALPFAVALTYPVDAVNFPRILLAAGGVQAGAFGIAWLAGLELVRRERAQQGARAGLPNDGISQTVEAQGVL